jgi:hypothetical protein
MIGEFIDKCSTGDLIVIGVCIFVVLACTLPVVFGFLAYITGMGE